MTEVAKKLLKKGIVGGYSLTKCQPELGETATFCVTEMHTMEEINQLLDALKVINEGLGGK